MTDEARNPSERREQIEALVVECLRRREGRPPARADVGSVCREHPDLVDDVRACLELLDEFGMGGDPGLRGLGTSPARVGGYELLRPLGGGAMGIVWEARRIADGAPVAVKAMRSEFAVNGRARRRFVREVEALRALDHPNVVRVLDAGEDGGVPFMVMPLVPGCSLSQALAEAWRGGRADLTGPSLLHAVARLTGREPSTSRPAGLCGAWHLACLHVARDVAAALAHAHDRGVHHRDVKPSNVMVTTEGRVLLLDFGLARIPGGDRLTASGATLGSRPYMSPEQVRGDRTIDHRTDLYSLGVMLHEMLLGRLPFVARTGHELRLRILAGDAAPPRRSDPHLPRDVETIVLRCMDVERGQRPRSARAVVEHLEAAMEGRPVSLRRVGPWVRARRALLRHPALAAAATSAVVVAAVVLAMRPGDGRAAALDGAATRPAASGDLSSAILPRIGLGVNRKRLAETLESDPLLAADVLRFLGGLRLARGEADAGRAMLAEAARLVGRVDSTAALVRWRTAALERSRLVAGTAVADALLEAVQAIPVEGALEEAATSRHLLARLLAGPGRQDEALALASSALSMRRAADPMDGPGAAADLALIAGLEAAARRVDEAGARLAAAEVEWARRRGDGPEVPGWLAAARARVLALRGDAEGAEAELRRVIAGRVHELGVFHPGVAADLVELGSLLFDRADYREAETVWRHAVTVRAAALAPRADEWRDLLLWARSLLAMGRCDAARAVVHAALDALARSPDAGAPAGLAYRLLGTVEHLAGRSQAAEAAYRCAEEHLQDRRDLARASVLASLSDVLAAAGRGRESAEALDEAESSLQAFAAHDLERFGPDSWRDLAWQELLGEIDLVRGRAADAAERLRTCWALRRERQGDGHPATCRTGSALGGALAAGGRLADAEAVLLDAYAALERHAPEDRDALDRTAWRLAALYEAWGRAAAAADWRARAPATPPRPAVASRY